ncbi:MAG: anthranilate phosphoribosyltransferase [Parvibaculales bacterium]
MSKLLELPPKEAFTRIMSGEAEAEDIKGFLLTLAERGESVEEIVAGAEILRQKALKVDAPENAIDSCGTGGDGQHTWNISTAVGFVLAGCGAFVAKHGNRAVSSQSGSSDVLAALGVRLDMKPEEISHAIREVGIGFLFAPAHHSAMRHVAPIRQELGRRTIFNLIGPLCNPADTKFQLMGVFDKKWLEPLAEALGRLGAKCAWVVHGEDGLDELTITGKSFVAEWKDGKINCFEITPEQAGLERAKPEALRGGNVEENAKALRAILEGEKNAYRDIVILNSAAGLYIIGKAKNIKEGAELAQKSIDEGHALHALEKLTTL